jgi:hypothetical protein
MKLMIPGRQAQDTPERRHDRIVEDPACEVAAQGELARVA